MPFSQFKLRMYIFGAGLKRNVPSAVFLSEAKTPTVQLNLQTYVFVMYRQLGKFSPYQDLKVLINLFATDSRTVVEMGHIGGLLD